MHHCAWFWTKNKYISLITKLKFCYHHKIDFIEIMYTIFQQYTILDYFVTADLVMLPQNYSFIVSWCKHHHRWQSNQNTIMNPHLELEQWWIRQNLCKVKVETALNKPHKENICKSKYQRGHRSGCGEACATDLSSTENNWSTMAAAVYASRE